MKSLELICFHIDASLVFSSPTGGGDGGGEIDMMSVAIVMEIMAVERSFIKLSEVLILKLKVLFSRGVKMRIELLPRRLRDEVGQHFGRF